MSKARDTDQAALDAFKEAFGEVVPVRSKDAKIRIGKIMIALNGVRAALDWATESGFDQNTIQGYEEQYRLLREEIENIAGERTPDMKLLETYKEVCRHLVDTIKKTRKKQKLTDLPQNSGIFVSDVPGLDDLDPQARQEKIAEVRGKVCRGSALSNSILTGDNNYDGVVPTKETVIDMCWYFKGMAQENLGEPYQQGALTIPDPDGRLAKFIDGCPDIYPRDSSHLRQQQRTQQSQGRGIDCGGAFPGGMNTVLLHPYVTENGERRLYVKFETAGAYKHLRTTKREVARRPENETDQAMSDAHAGSVMGQDKEKKEKDLAETREGTVNMTVLAAYQAVYDAAPDLRNHLEPGKQASKMNSEGKVTTFSRVRSFVPALAPTYWDVQQQTKNMVDLLTALQGNQQRAQQLIGRIRAWRDAMHDAGYATDACDRLGDEVVLRQNDMRQIQSNDPTESDIDRDRGLISMMDLLEQRKAQQKVLLEGTKKKIPYVYYQRLVFRVPNQRPVTHDHVLTIDTEVKQFERYKALRSKVETGVIDKGTNLLKKKYFEFTGNVTQEEMFAALSATGWNMANLTKAADLKKK